MGPLVIQFRFHVCGLIAIGQWQPGGGTICEPGIGTSRPLERGSLRIPGVLLEDIRVRVAGPRIDRVLPADLPVGHADLLSLIGDAGSWEDHHQHVHGIDVLSSIPTGGPSLVVISQLESQI